MKLRARYSKLGKIRFTSHRDTARHWERAVRKAGVSVAYSAGFTPRPKISFGLALPTGGESLAEYLDLELEPGEERSLDELASVFTAELPAGYEVARIVPREQGSPSLQDAVVACSWRLTLADVDRDHAAESASRFLAAPTVMVERERKGQRSVDDVRPAVLDLTVVNGDDDPRPHLCAVLATSGRGLRPLELVAALFPEHDAVDVAARVLRTEQWIDSDGERREIIPAQPAATRAEGRA